MLCLGIECTAHTFGCAVVSDDGKVFSNVKSMYVSEQGGIRPVKAAEHHVSVFNNVLIKALQEAKIDLKDIDLLAVSTGPGLGQCLRIGAVGARVLALRLGKPLVPVNHCIAHVEIGKLQSGFKDPITLYVSGANTQILAFASGRYRVFGETLDIGCGNFLDSFGRLLGIGFPAGPKIESLAAKGKKYVALPYTIKGMDFAFSGILTKLKQFVQSGNYTKEDLCYSAQETVFAILTEATERAIAHIDKNEVLLTGGVASNERLAEMLATMCADRGVRFAVVQKDFATDNAAMIAWTGLLAHLSGEHYSIADTKIKPYWRTEQVDVTWIKN
ncbi:MAG: bifunctional N(6)-L-threonylcarbamoyladenine synthase/serine/threonine protein kinase [Candidatus Nanoarchaeia archaeon]